MPENMIGDIREELEDEMEVGDRYSDRHGKSERGLRPECIHGKDTVCGHHEVIEERRDFDRNRFDDHKKDYASFKRTTAGHISNLCTFKNRSLGAALLAFIFVTGGYGYTYRHQVYTDARYQMTIAKMERLEDDFHEEMRRVSAEFNLRIDRTNSEVAVNKTNMAVLVSRLDTTNEQLKEAIKLMRTEIEKTKG